VPHSGGVLRPGRVQANGVPDFTRRRSPLSTTLDSVGSIARSVACCETIDAILAGQREPAASEVKVAGLRFAAPQNYVLDGVDAAVAAAFGAAIAAPRTRGRRRRFSDHS
jgi:Asp-tRNA(Asn)/Glu-tRNA(Gln) amidotransferase A subunit family amidase